MAFFTVLFLLLSKWLRLETRRTTPCATKKSLALAARQAACLQAAYPAAPIDLTFAAYPAMVGACRIDGRRECGVGRAGQRLIKVSTSSPSQRL